MKKSDDTYIRVLQQVISIDYDGNGHVFRTLGVHTDISHLKTEGVPVLSFIGLNGQPSFIDVAAEKMFKPTPLLSPREREVLLMLADGKKSKEIASRLFISKDTVDTHRRNILAKTGALNTAELIRKATRDGWI
jgi:DNA-binding CsgD family transcriptional regulator